MPITTLSGDAVNASRASALLAAQVRDDLMQSGFKDSSDLIHITGRITAALIVATASGGGALSLLPSKLGV